MMRPGVQWEEIRFFEKLGWWIKFLIFLALAIPVSLLEFIFLPHKRRGWTKTWQRIWFMWTVVFWPPLRTSLERRAQSLRQIEFLNPEFPHLNLSFEFNNLFRYSLATVIIVVILYAISAAWLVLPKVDLSLTQGIPTPFPTGVVEKSTLQRFEEEFELVSEYEFPDEVTTNLALIRERGQISYSPYTFEFESTPPWQEVSDILYISALQVSEKGVELVDNHGSRHFLNLNQPFVFFQQQKFVYLIDEKGQIWMAEIAKLEKVKANK